MHFLSTCLLSLLAISNVYAASLTLQSPRFTISSPDATQLRSEPLSTTKKPSPLVLGAKDVLKLTFQVVEEEGKGVQPHQTFLRFYDEVSGEEGIQPVRVTTGGKAKFELNMAKPPASLPPTTSTDPLKVTLIIGSFTHDPFKVDLFDLFLPASQPAPQHPDEPSFHSLPEIHHTFRADPKLPPKFISAAFAGLVLAPWVVLLGLWGAIRPTVPHLFSPNILPFLATLSAFEGLLFWYWVDLKLGQVLLYGGILTVPTLVAGKQALSTMGKWRTGRK
ncbi:Oligosaccharyltransferase subunit Ribophorin II-domain-containing protein [Cristinia sonorae]|uniref:Ribophorin II n=1 Tax=Cristinia sonorae TaxID=1940300 RepID=A0A8K0UQ74_9AGAR|nr:Oligosaccharyltransferase subunit Ribophorin II-domain-containing protein [Cristinia sonorae]